MNSCVKKIRFKISAPRWKMNAHDPNLEDQA